MASAATLPIQITQDKRRERVRNHLHGEGLTLASEGEIAAETVLVFPK